MSVAPTIAPTVAPTVVPTICTNVTAQNYNENYDRDDYRFVQIYCNSRGLSYEDAAYIFLAVLFIILLLLFCLYRLLKALVDYIQKQLQYVKWSEDSNESFRKKYGYGHEWVFVMPVYRDDAKLTTAQAAFTHKHLITTLTDASFGTRMHYSQTHECVFIKVRLPPEPMKKFADNIDYKMKLNSSKLRAKLEKGKKEVSLKID